MPAGENNSSEKGRIQPGAVVYLILIRNPLRRNYLIAVSLIKQHFREMSAGKEAAE